MHARKLARNLLLNPKSWAGITGMALVVALGFGQAALEREAAAQTEGLTWGPIFEVDPLWPRPLPNNWVIGSAIGVSVDDRDHVWIVHREATLNAGEIEAAADPQVAVDCCVPAPPVLEFDPQGNVVRHWGGPGEGYEWPRSNHGITVDYKGNVWIGGNDANDAHILKFNRHGGFLLQVGRAGMNQGSNDMQNFHRVAEISVDALANEAYVSDGYGNKRVVVLDADTGEFKRYWGAYGNVPDDADPGRYDPRAPPARQFRTPVHCAEMSHDRLLYVCDRANDRIQVFNPDGTFVDEMFVERETLGSGSVWDIAFSHDGEQKYLYIADGTNEKVYIVERETLTMVSSFGNGGRQPGQFYGTHNVAVDSLGNIYTTETYEGKRLQKFVYKGEGPIRTPHQGALWPGAD